MKNIEKAFFIVISILVICLSIMIDSDQKKNEEIALLESEIEILKSFENAAIDRIEFLDNYADELKDENSILKKELKIYQENISIYFNPLDVTSPSFSSLEQMESILSRGLSGLGQSYLDAEREYGVNAIFLYSLTALESASGTSNFARNRNNISGFTAYDDTVNESTSYFKSKHDCIMTTAKVLSRDYLSVDGKYYRGLSIWSINKNYALDKKWADKIMKIGINAIYK